MSPTFNYQKPQQIKTRRQKSVRCFFADSTFFTAKNGSQNILEPLSAAYLSHSHAGRYRPQPIGGQQLLCSASPLTYVGAFLFFLAVYAAEATNMFLEKINPFVYKHKTPSQDSLKPGFTAAPGAPRC